MSARAGYLLHTRGGLSRGVELSPILAAQVASHVHANPSG
jgi:hypothetical protein